MSYAVYVLVPVLLALAHVQLTAERPPGATARDFGAPVRPGLARRAAVPAAVLAVLVLCALSGMLLEDQRLQRALNGHAYLATAADGAVEWTRPDTTVLPLYSPEPVAGSWAEDFGRHESLLPMLLRGWSPGPLRDRTVVLDDRAHVRLVALQEEARGELPGLGADATGCLGAKGDRLTFPLEKPVSGSPLFVSVTYQLTEVSGPPRADESSRARQQR